MSSVAPPLTTLERFRRTLDGLAFTVALARSRDVAERSRLALSLQLCLRRRATNAGRAALVLGALLCIPWLAFIAVSLPGGGDSPFLFDGRRVGMLVLAAPLVALVVNAFAVLRVRLLRVRGVELLVTLEGSLLQLAVGALALVLVGLFASHLAVDAFACANGVTRAC